MFYFNPSRVKFFKKDGDGEDEVKDENVKTFFDILDLKGGGGSTVKDEEDEQEEEAEEENEKEDEEEVSSNPELIALQEQLKLAQEQNAKMMAMLENKDTPKEEEKLTDPFESDAFDNLATTMEWEDDERKAMKAFMQNALAYQNQTILSNATSGITDIVNSSMSQAEKKKAVQKQFFTENPKLKPVKDYVSTVASGVLKEYKALGKSLNPTEILAEAAKRAYQVLNINPQTDDNEEKKSERDSNPAFPSIKSGSKKRNQKVNKTTTQKMITSMLDL